MSSCQVARPLCKIRCSLGCSGSTVFCISSINNYKEVIVAYFTTILQDSPQANAVTVKNLLCIYNLPIRFEPGTYVTEITSVATASNSSVTLGVIHSF